MLGDLKSPRSLRTRQTLLLSAAMALPLAGFLAASSLEALGLGPTRVPTLGMTIFYAIRAAAILRGMWWWWGPPIFILIILFSGLFLMNIGLDEIANPRLSVKKKAVAA